MGPVANNFTKFGIVQFLSHEYLEQSQTVHIYQTFIVHNNLHEQQTYTVFQYPYKAKNWHFCTPIIVNISIPPTLDPKSFDIHVQRIL